MPGDVLGDVAVEQRAARPGVAQRLHLRLQVGLGVGRVAPDLLLEGLVAG